MQNRQAYVYFGPSNITYTSLTVYFSELKTRARFLRKYLFPKLISFMFVEVSQILKLNTPLNYFRLAILL